MALALDSQSAITRLPEKIIRLCLFVHGVMEILEGFGQCRIIMVLAKNERVPGEY